MEGKESKPVTGYMLLDSDFGASLQDGSRRIYKVGKQYMEKGNPYTMSFFRSASDMFLLGSRSLVTEKGPLARYAEITAYKEHENNGTCYTNRLLVKKELTLREVFRKVRREVCDIRHGLDLLLYNVKDEPLITNERDAVLLRKQDQDTKSLCLNWANRATIIWNGSDSGIMSVGDNCIIQCAGPNLDLYCEGSRNKIILDGDSSRISIYGRMATVYVTGENARLYCSATGTTVYASSNSAEIFAEQPCTVFYYNKRGDKVLKASAWEDFDPRVWFKIRTPQGLDDIYPLAEI